MRPKEAAAVVLSIALLGVVMLWGTPSGSPAVEHVAPAPAPAAAEVLPDPQTLAVPVTAGPITYYTANCARCHGDASAAYEGIINPKHGDALRQVISDMVDGPAQAAIDPTQLDDQVRLHEAMFDHKPYAWFDAAAAGVITGEKLDNTRVGLANGDVTTDAKVDGYRFVLPKSSHTPVVRGK